MAERLDGGETNSIDRISATQEYDCEEEEDERRMMTWLPGVSSSKGRLVFSQTQRAYYIVVAELILARAAAPRERDTMVE